MAETATSESARRGKRGTLAEAIVALGRAPTDRDAERRCLAAIAGFGSRMLPGRPVHGTDLMLYARWVLVEADELGLPDMDRASCDSISRWLPRR